ncbi:hypothetical protein PUN28_011059 [Cardiocondyla obscurior]|uniref:Uncharacterized protein n=1 Tax=Cardiocondyla obscurior TaxID=286306 RepID=A0AAW2FKG1_9HYME
MPKERNIDCVTRFYPRFACLLHMPCLEHLRPRQKSSLICRYRRIDSINSYRLQYSGCNYRYYSFTDASNSVHRASYLLHKPRICICIRNTMW